jgi:hypothetical protein
MLTLLWRRLSFPNYRARKRVVLAIGAVAVALTLFTGGKPYSANPDDVRTQFNSDKGKVRLLMLLSPT